jgi:sugar/nucleoside kinase (ribokinase family)
MRTDLGAASSFSPEEVSAADFEECSHAHVEGYLLFNPDLAEAVLKSARQAGCTVSLDLGSYEVVQGAAEVLPGMLADYVDVVMANEDEAAAFCGDSDPEVGLEALSRLCELAVVKLGREGAIMKSGDATCRAGARRVEDVKDTTGAGDFWAAGFLYGLINQSGLEDCGRLGAVLGGEAVRHMGADLPAPAWADIIDYFDQYLEER